VKLSKNKRDALREKADAEWVFCGADIRLLLAALDEAEAENERLREMLRWIAKRTTDGGIFGAIEHLRLDLATRWTTGPDGTEDRCLEVEHGENQPRRLRRPRRRHGA
jgi:hypothetical protein